MIVVALVFVLVVMGIVLTGLGGIFRTGESHAGVVGRAVRSERGMVKILLVGGVLMVGLVVMSGVGVLITGVRPSTSSDPDSTRTVPHPTTTTSTQKPSPDGAVAVADDRLGSPVEVAVPRATHFALPTTVSGVRDGTVSPVLARGFGSQIGGSARQCVMKVDGASLQSCARPYPIRFDESGTAQFLFLFDARMDAQGCRASSSCFLVVQDARGRRGVVHTVFGALEEKSTSVRMEPLIDLEKNDVVRVRIVGAGEGARVSVSRCVPPGPIDPEACFPVVRGEGVDTRGTAEFTLPVASSLLGEGDEEASVRTCSPGELCALAVFVDGVGVAVERVSLSAGPSARYDGMRLSVGLALAFVLGMIAVVLARGTDWRGAPDPFEGQEETT